MGNRIVHFEIPAGDVEKLSKFYSDLFDWKFSKQSMPGMDYWMIETTGQGPETPRGGMYAKQGETDRPRLYVAVDNIDAHTEKLKQAGGIVIVEKQEIPQMGWSVIAKDPENNLIASIPADAAATRTKEGSAKESSRKEKGKAKEKEQKEVANLLLFHMFNTKIGNKHF